MIAELQRRGFEVNGVDLRGEIGSKTNGRDDVRRAYTWSTDVQFDLVIHAAAHVGGRVDIEGRPTFLGAYNLQLDGAIFEWALRAKPEHLVYLSSSAVYPVSLQGTWAGGHVLVEDDVDLDNPELPDATYGWTKLTGERLAVEARAEGLAVHTVRPFSGYGIDQGIDYPFGALLERVIGLADPVEVWGGRQERDWIHIDDVIGAILAIVEADIRFPVNIATGRGVQLAELAMMFAEAMRTEAAPDYTPALNQVEGKPMGVSYRVGDPATMHQFWTPRISVEEGVERAIRAHVNRAAPRS
jgi:nucleoside-diphosphate-sugar epimerase